MLTKRNQQVMDDYLEKKESFAECTRALKLIADKGIRLSEFTEAMNDHGEETSYAVMEGDKRGLYDYEITIRRVHKDPDGRMEDLKTFISESTGAVPLKQKGTKQWLTKDQSTT